MARIVVSGLALLIPFSSATTLFSIENYYYAKREFQDLLEYKDSRVVKVDLSTGAVTALTGWKCHCSPTFSPLSGCGFNDQPMVVIYNGDYESQYQRTNMLTASGSIFDLHTEKFIADNVYGHGGSFKMADMGDGFPYAVGHDKYIPNQVSVFTVGGGQPVGLGHIATIVMDSDRSKYGLWAPEVAIAAACDYNGAGGCNIPGSYTYIHVGEYGSHGGLHVISRGNGTIAKIPVSGIEGYPSDMGAGFHVEALWVDLNVHLPTKVVLAGYHSGQSDTVMYEVDLVTGVAVQKIQIAGLGKIDKCNTYDNAVRQWYMGCSTIATVSVDTWKVVSRQSVKHESADYSLAGLEFLRTSPVSQGGHRNLVKV